MEVLKYTIYLFPQLVCKFIYWQASVFFAYIYTLYGRHEQEIPLEENLSNEEKQVDNLYMKHVLEIHSIFFIFIGGLSIQILVNNSAEFLSTFYEFFDTDHMYRLLCTT